MNDTITVDVTDPLEYLSEEPPNLIYLFVKAFSYKVTNGLDDFSFEEALVLIGDSRVAHSIPFAHTR